MRTRTLPVVALACLAVAPAAHATSYPTQPLSPGPATGATISQDGRLASYAAYVAADGGADQVFLVRRAKPYGRNGTPWRAGETHRASGRPGNGDSWGPVFDGYDYSRGGRETIVAPSCMAFVSEASNLVPGDHDGHADVFVRRLGSGRLTRIATPAAASEVALDGTCDTLALVAGGAVYKARADGRGPLHRISRDGGASSLTVSVNGDDVTYGRAGAVWFSSDGRTRRIARGTNPAADDWSKRVAFEDGGLIKQANLAGAVSAKAVVQAGGDTPRGVQPSESTTGSFVFYAQGDAVRLSGFSSPMGSCSGSPVVDPIGSGHGNYVVFNCLGGGAFLTYVGPK